MHSRTASATIRAFDPRPDFLAHALCRYRRSYRHFEPLGALYLGSGPPQLSWTDRPGLSCSVPIPVATQGKTLPDIACRVGLLSCLYEWQTGIAGGLGFAAAIAAVLFTLGAERRKADREFRALRRALGVEIRQFIASAFQSFLRCQVLLGEVHHSAYMIQSRARLHLPVIFPAASMKIAEFGDQATDLLLFFNRVLAQRETAARLSAHPRSDDIPNQDLAMMVNVLIAIAANGAMLLPHIKSEIDSYDETDLRVMGEVIAATRDWVSKRNSYAPFQSDDTPAEYLTRR
jgi:hypothetical protein